MCAKAIINADIKEVYYIEEYKSDLVGLELLSKHNIKTHKINN
jgi:deoxycytidylate deaminase